MPDNEFAARADSIVTVNYGSSDLLATALEFVPSDIGVVVVDNFSSISERARLHGIADDRGWSVVDIPGNPGFGAAANAGIEAARKSGSESVLLLNPDVVIDEPTVRALLDDARDHPGALVSPTLMRTDGSPYFIGSSLDLHTGRIRSRPDPSDAGCWMPWITATCLAVSVPEFVALGGFDGEYFMYWEDVDLSYRAQQAGRELRLRTDLIARHDPGGTQHDSSSRARSPLFYRWNCRNRLTFAAKHMGNRARARWIRNTPREVVMVYLLGGRRQLLRRPWSVLAPIRGALEGLLRMMRRG